MVGRFEETSESRQLKGCRFYRFCRFCRFCSSSSSGADSPPLEPTPVLLHKLHRCTFNPAPLVVEGQQLVACRRVKQKHVSEGSNSSEQQRSAPCGPPAGPLRGPLTCAPAASWSVESGAEELLGSLLLGARRAALLHRRHRVGSTNPATAAQVRRVCSRRFWLIKHLLRPEVQKTEF